MKYLSIVKNFLTSEERAALSSLLYQDSSEEETRFIVSLPEIGGRADGSFYRGNGKVRIMAPATAAKYGKLAVCEDFVSLNEAQIKELIQV